MNIPFIWSDDKLTAKDFVQLELQFIKTISYFLPCESVYFMDIDRRSTVDPLAESTTDEFVPETWRAGVDLVKKEQQPVINSGGCLLFLPIWHNQTIIAIAVLTGGDSVQYGDYSVEWLHERSRLISREFRKIKQWSSDPQSGLFNILLLREDIEAILRLMEVDDEHPDCEKVGFMASESGDARAAMALFLVEILPRRGASGQVAAHIAKAGACLSSLQGDSVPVCHLGTGLFGMLWSSEGNEESRKLGYALLRKLKRQNFTKVHIGIAPLAIKKVAEQPLTDFRQQSGKILENGWQALLKAKKRGPCAICAEGGEVAENSFHKPSASVADVLKKLWRRSNCFSIVLLHDDCPVETDKPFSKRLCSLIGEEAEILPENGIEAYVYLPDFNEQRAASWLAQLKKKINSLGKTTYSMGVASYPCSRFKKVDIPVNARKALFHAGFYGPDTVTFFSGISLNISGDVFYNEGDLASSIREYKLGLELDSDNVNLMNSLAVIYAQMNRYHLTIPLFERALVIDNRDFMALFNLGFAFLRCNDVGRSVYYYEKAMTVDPEYFDLLLQLGQVYCQLGRYQEAVKILTQAEQLAAKNNKVRPWQNANGESYIGKESGDGLVYRYLSEAYHGINKRKEAMAYLQRAIGYNSRDSEALSRLGEIYMEEGQGVEIALSLCREAVNIDDRNGSVLCRLAKVQIGAGHLDDGLGSLKQCLAQDGKNLKVLLAVATIYEELKRHKQAERIYDRIVRLDRASPEAIKVLARNKKEKK